MSNALVWCNGRFVGGWPYGYSSFRLDLTDSILPGASNVLSIRLSNKPETSRWYPGAGLYRNVWLIKQGPVHVAHWGTSITARDVSEASAAVAMRVQVENSSEQAVQAQVTGEVYATDDAGGLVGPVLQAMRAGPVAIGPGSATAVDLAGTLEHPRLWSLETPNRYRVVTTVSVAGTIVDRYEDVIGIRSLDFTAEEGFRLNGRRVRIQGVCNHHDLGALGAAFNLRAAERQLEILKEMGVNALRTSHNPPAPELLDLCDRMGVLVMDESFDCWKIQKTKDDYHLLWNDWYEKDLRALIRRDINHPCVFMWSTGNEIIDIRAKNALAMATEVSAVVRREDPTRPCTIGANSTEAFRKYGVQKCFDLWGMNYQEGRYDLFHKENPTIPLFGSETSSCISTRGEYFFQTEAFIAEENARREAEAKLKNRAPPKPLIFTPIARGKGGGCENFQVSSYDLYAPSWAMPPDQEFQAQDKFPYVLGEFVWTGFDYLGEPTPYNQDLTNLLNFHDAESRAQMERQLKELGKIKSPARSSYFGIVDLAGFKKDRFFLYQARWRPALPMAHILPHWNWPERLGQVTPVHVYTSGDEAELFLNGTSLGRKRQEPGTYRLRWDDVVYAPGELKVVAYKSGKEWATDVVRTTGQPSALLMAADRPDIVADGLDLSFVTVTVADAKGFLVPRSKPVLEFSIEGPGEIVATDNGDPTSLEPFQLATRKAFNGLALAIVRSKPGQAGTITLKVRSQGLAGAAIEIHGRK